MDKTLTTESKEREVPRFKLNVDREKDTDDDPYQGQRSQKQMITMRRMSQRDALHRRVQDSQSLDINLTKIATESSVRDKENYSSSRNPGGHNLRGSTTYNESQSYDPDAAEESVIQDKQLQRFYEHLDSVNHKRISPFQEFQRHRMKYLKEEIADKLQRHNTITGTLPLEKRIKGNKYTDVRNVVIRKPIIVPDRDISRYNQERTQEV